MHVIACPNHPPVISWPHEFQHLLLFVLGWRKVNWELHVGWRLRVACMWLCVPYFSPLFFALANGFHFIAIPLSMWSNAFVKYLSLVSIRKHFPTPTHPVCGDTYH